MPSIYLDQAKWIDLGRADHGRPGGERFVEALQAGRAAASSGQVHFPLSIGHYIETWRAGAPDRRQRLATTMISLSRGRTIAHPPRLCDDELDDVLEEEFRIVRARRKLTPLGWGFPHAAGFAMPLRPLDLDVELEHLATRPDGFTEYGRGHQAFGDDYKAGEEQLVAGAADNADLHEAIIAGSAVMEIHANIASALDRAGLPVDALGPIGLARPDLPAEFRVEVVRALLPVAAAFIGRLPTRDAALRLRLLRHRDKGVKWEANDLNDIAYLSSAVVHCEAIVTEKQWVHELSRSGLLKEHRTLAISDVAAVPDLIESLISKD
jgi:hypothetical protein